MPATVWIALIRAIGGATHAKMSMAQLRAGCEAQGFADVQTVLATGNVIFRSDLPEPQVKSRLVRVMADHGLANAVFLRRPDDLRAAIAANPFPERVAANASNLLILFMETAPDLPAHAQPAGHAGPERVQLIGREALIDYPETIGQSKLTADRLERHFGQPGTARNWNTVQRLLAAAERMG